MERAAGREWGSHLASVLARCPGASSAFTRQKACQELEVTLCKTLYSLGNFTGVEKGGKSVCLRVKIKLCSPRKILTSVETKEWLLSNESQDNGLSYVLA